MALDKKHIDRHPEVILARRIREARREEIRRAPRPYSGEVEPADTGAARWSELITSADTDWDQLEADSDRTEDQ